MLQLMDKNKPVKVLHLTYDMRIGGTEMVIKNLIEGSQLKALQHQIFCIETPLGPWGQELKSKGINIAQYTRSPGFDKKLIWAIRNYIKQHNIDVLHCHQYTPWVYGCIAAMFTSTKVIFTEHGRFYPDFGTWKRKLVNPILCRFSSQITAISKATKEALIKYENIPEQKIEVIYNGIEPLTIDEYEVAELKTRFNITKETQVLGTVARLDSIKNHKMMLNAFAQVLKGNPKTVLIIVGDGEERSNIERQIKSLGIQEKVILPGYDPKPAKYLGLMDIYLLSSFSEGTSMTLLEAMSIGKPCVVTNAGGNPEIIIDTENGLVTANDDAQAFCEAILFCMSNASATQSMQQQAKIKFAEKFSVSQMTSSYLKLYLKKIMSGSIND